MAITFRDKIRAVSAYLGASQYHMILHIKFLQTFGRHMALVAIASICMAVAMSSCSSDEEADEPAPVVTGTVEHTLFMYFPWSTNLTNCFYQNIADLESSIVAQNGLKDQRVIVFMSTSAASSKMFEITYAGGACHRRDIRTYASPSLTTAEGISSILSDMSAAAPARRYAMTIGCHGMGWLPVNPSTRMSAADISPEQEVMHWSCGTSLLTRYFGAMDKAYQTDISTLADAIDDAGLKMDYILFDDCYMANVEVAYELKDVADHLIASTCEVMAYGMPYDRIGRHLMGEPDYEAICNEFHAFYANSSTPWGTLSVTDCSQLDGLAAVMKRINESYGFIPSALYSLQSLDGYSPSIFYDYGDYVEHLMGSANPQLLSEFRAQLALTVPYKVNTPTYYTAIRDRTLPIHKYSGLTTSDPSVHYLSADREHTAWWKATH